MSAHGADIWKDVADAFGRLRGRRTQALWLDAARPGSFHRGLFTLDVASPSAKAAIDARYRPDLETLFHELTGSPVRVQTRVFEAPTEADGDGRAATAPPPRGARGDRPARPDVDRAAAHRRRHAAPPPWAGHFAATDANALALAAVERFVLSPDRDFNPLYIHGPAGSGKTELGRHALRCLTADEAVHDPLVVSGESLARDLHRALRAGELRALHRDWQQRDMVLLDEVHRLRGQRRAQAETVTLIQGVLERGGRVLMMSRHAPRDIHGLDERLASHLASAMIVSLAEPGTADRRTVLEAACGGLAVAVDAGVPELIAARAPGNLTDAVALLGQLAAEAAATGGVLDMARARRRIDRGSPGSAGIDALLDSVCQATGVDVGRIRSPEKAREVASARHLVVYLATRSLGLSARQVCRHLGLRSPSVAAYARRQVERRRHLDAGFDALVHRLQARIEGAQRDLAW